jgi:hypothetical protein
MGHWSFSFSKSSTINLLKKILAIIGCLVFLFSFVSPFYYSNPMSMIEQSYSIYYWSFKADEQHYWVHSYTGDRQYWLYDYWFNDYYAYATYPGLSWVLIFMFIAQILTLVTGIASIFVSSRIVSLIPIISCLTTIALMVHVNMRISENLVGRFSYQQGYWLTYPSLFLFLYAFIFHLYSSREKTLHPHIL